MGLLYIVVNVGKVKLEYFLKYEYATFDVIETFNTLCYNTICYNEI